MQARVACLWIWGPLKEVLEMRQYTWDAYYEKFYDWAESSRTYGAIESRLDYLGLKKKPFWLFGRKRV